MRCSATFGRWQMKKTLEAVIANRYEVMVGYARMRSACKDELDALKAKGADVSVIKSPGAGYIGTTTRCWLPCGCNWRKFAPRTRFSTRWSRCAKNFGSYQHPQSREQLAGDLAAWCHRAEASGIAALRDFSVRLRMARS